jgi:hypothetical protein
MYWETPTSKSKAGMKKTDNDKPERLEKPERGEIQENFHWRETVQSALEGGQARKDSVLYLGVEGPPSMTTVGGAQKLIFILKTKCIGTRKKSDLPGQGHYLWRDSGKTKKKKKKKKLRFFVLFCFLTVLGMEPGPCVCKAIPRSYISSPLLCL